MKPGHAEIAGGGFAGLTLAVGLAAAGWSVKVHERSAKIREIGAGIFIHANGLSVLKDLGLMDVLATRGVRLERDMMIDAKGKVLQNRGLLGDSVVWSFPRLALIEALHAKAVEVGVEIQTGSEIASAKPDGSLIDVTGTRYQGDLVVGADGYRSAVAKSLGLQRHERKMGTTSIRFLLNGRDLTPDPMTTEHWSGRRRIAVAACGPEHTYVYMACPETDEPGSEVPLNVDSWAKSFPQIRELFVLLREEEAYKAWYSYAQTTPWSQGNAVVVGDAAHALAPTLGQGSNLAMSNARSLVTFLNESNSVSQALEQWEKKVRYVTDSTQKWASRYNDITKAWPPALSFVRARIIWGFGASKKLNAHLRLADRTPPVLGAPGNGLPSDGTGPGGEVA